VYPTSGNDFEHLADTGVNTAETMSSTGRLESGCEVLPPLTSFPVEPLHPYNMPVYPEAPELPVTRAVTSIFKV
jgi:hypothetical protein